MEKKSVTDYKNQFAREKYDKITITIPKGMKAEWQKEAKELGVSLTALIQKRMGTKQEG